MLEVLTFIGQNIATLVVAAIAVAIGFKKILTLFERESAVRAAASSELQLINLLREQVKDLNEANKQLREEIESLRALNRSLISENEEFKEEIRRLKAYIENYFSGYMP